jgi:hypothetical protein
VNGWTAQVSIRPWEAWKLYANYFGGTSASNGQALSTYEAGIEYDFIPNSASITFLVRELKIANVEQFLLYRAQLDYNF